MHLLEAEGFPRWGVPIRFGWWVCLEPKRGCRYWTIQGICGEGRWPYWPISWRNGVKRHIRYRHRRIRNSYIRVRNRRRNCHISHVRIRRRMTRSCLMASFTTHWTWSLTVSRIVNLRSSSHNLQMAVTNTKLIFKKKKQKHSTKPVPLGVPICLHRKLVNKR
jgi:hypothetical protein